MFRVANVVLALAVAACSAEPALPDGGATAYPVVRAVPVVKRPQTEPAPEPRVNIVTPLERLHDDVRRTRDRMNAE